MKRTEMTLIEQLRITDLELEDRKALFAITRETGEALKKYRDSFEQEADSLVSRFYEHQTSVPEIALLIGDADTLERLHSAQRKYVRDLFSGIYDIEYVNNRLRIGLVHHRIGVEPRLYLSAIQALKQLLLGFLRQAATDESDYQKVAGALECLINFDVSLVFDTYIRSLVSEIEVSREKTERYAAALEEKVRKRTAQLERISRTDPLTGLLNIRHLKEILAQTIGHAQRHHEPVTVVYFDVNDFKAINDNLGHARGDEVLRLVARTIREISRVGDHCFRYGGDEFCVILAGFTAEQAEAVFEPRMRQEIQKQDLTLTVSIGYAHTGPEEFLSPDELVHLADERMYAAKNSRRTARWLHDVPGPVASVETREDKR